MVHVPPSTSAGAPSLRPREIPATLVVVATFTNPIEAELAKGLLEANAINAFLKDDGIVGVAWHLSNAVGGVKLTVAEEDVAAARLLLENAAEPPRPAQPPIDDEEVLQTTEADRMALRAWRASVLGLMLPLVMHLYSLRLMILAVTQADVLSARGRRYLAGALVFDAFVLGCTLACVRYGWFPGTVPAY